LVPLSPVRLRFAGRTTDYWRLMIRGAILQVITLGIYRFWLSTDMRRFLWAATDVKGDTPDYTGTAVELLIGFLIAIGILIPIYALFFVASLEFGMLSEMSGAVAFVVLAGFGQYAAYRTRRYRLTRTVFRGLRFHQSGSALRYAVRAMLWWIPTVLTLGLAWPWALANLERYKMRNTFYGDMGGSFAGSGGRLFSRGFLIWLLVIGPLVLGLAAELAVIDWSAVMDALDGDDSGDLVLKKAIDAIFNDSIKYGDVAFAIGVTWSMLAGAVLYPAYQAIVMWWWLGGLRLGGAAAASDLRIGRYYGAYLRYLLYVLVFSIAFVAAGGVVFVLGYAALNGVINPARTPVLADLTTVAAPVAAYVIYILGVYTIYQVVVKMRLWQAAVESMLVSDYAAFDHVHASDADSSAVGEGLADALGGGGI
jgi:uncharacterized membrane protein YjgN (DUF898 family)